MDSILKYFPELSFSQIQHFEALYPLYEKWNQKINVISRKDFEHFYEHHVLHSLAIAKVFQFEKGYRVLDIGTGGGFPGIPLSIYFSDAEFLLVDSIGKKVKVVNEVVKELGLKNVEVEQKRVGETKYEQFNYAVCRAVAPLNRLCEWTKGKVNTGLICLKGGDLQKEIKMLNRKVHLYKINDYFREAYFEEKVIVNIPAG